MIYANAVRYVYDYIIIPKDFIVGIIINFLSFDQSHLMVSDYINLFQLYLPFLS